jgi:hypothetical protein
MAPAAGMAEVKVAPASSKATITQAKVVVVMMPVSVTGAVQHKKLPPHLQVVLEEVVGTLVAISKEISKTKAILKEHLAISSLSLRLSVVQEQQALEARLTKCSSRTSIVLSLRMT